jgi:bacillopeptidase F
MKKLYWTLFLSVLLVALTKPSAGQNAFLDQSLIEELDNSSPSELIPVALMLSDEVNLLELKEEFNLVGLPASRRPALVKSALQEKADETQPAVISFIENSGYDHGPITRFWISNSIALKAEPELIEELSFREDIAYIYHNKDAFGYMPKPLKGDGNAAKIEGGIEPGLEAIGAPEMWAMGYTGHGRIGMTYDTGVWPDHPSHASRFLANRMPVLSTWFGYDSPVPVDKSSSHGTHVTGTMLGLDTATADTIGVAPRAYYIATDPVVSNLAFVKPLTDFMFGYEWALDPDGDPETTSDVPDVINNSWGFGPDLDEAPCPEFVVPVFNALEAAGIANVFSAGNEGPGEMTMSVPHNTNTGLVNSFTVGATVSTGSFNIASFSSRGPSICGGEGSLLIKPEVSAPGVNVRSSIENGEYDFFNGTSMAAPHVSGAVLLLKEAFPDVTGEEILLALYNSATDLGESGEDNTYGMGFINVKDAYDLLAETHTPTPPAVLDADIELVKILSPTETLVCALDGEFITPVIEVQNNGNANIEGFTAIISFGNSEVETVAEITDILLPGETYSFELPSVEYSGEGLQELHVRIESFPGEYDVLNNHGVHRFTKIPAYDWSIEGPFSENFSEGINEDLWTVLNPDAAMTWDTIPALQSDGSTGMTAYMNHPNYLAAMDELDHLVSPLFINQPAENNRLVFDYFYRKRSSNDFTKDTLVVYINRGCEGDFTSEELFRAGGDDLWTNDDSETNAFPESVDDWETLYLELDLEEDEPYYFTVTAVNRRGNNLLIDNFRMDSNLSTDDRKTQLKAKLFPNPAKDSFILDWENGTIGRVTITDITGKVVRNLVNVESGTLINTTRLNQGVYLVSLQVNDYRITNKLVVQ